MTELLDSLAANGIRRYDQSVTPEIREGLGRVFADAAQYGILGLELHQVRLEEVFMDSYGQGGGTQHA